jgi:hypothetical protein
MVYRNGRRSPCGDAFPDAGRDAALEACVARSSGDAPMAEACAATTATAPQGAAQ